MNFDERVAKRRADEKFHRKVASIILVAGLAGAVMVAGGLYFFADNKTAVPRQRIEIVPPSEPTPSHQRMTSPQVLVQAIATQLAKHPENTPENVATLQAMINGSGCVILQHDVGLVKSEKIAKAIAAKTQATVAYAYSKKLGGWVLVAAVMDCG